MPRDLSLLGVDIGSVSVSLVEIGVNQPARCVYAIHQGEPRRCFENLLKDFDLSLIGGVALTASTPAFLDSEYRYDDRLCIMRACRHLHEGVGSILIVGGEKFGLIRFDSEGNYQSYRGNSSCAAGTGSFLDQQARRLKLDGIQALSGLAGRNRGALPNIASRCAVFAKTDLVHAQQEGYALPEICDGLCYGLAKNIANTVFTGAKALSPILFVGGVSQNEAVVRHLERCIGQKLILDGFLGHGALGAALLLHDEMPAERLRPLVSSDGLFVRKTASKEYCHPPLELERSHYPDFVSRQRYLYSGDRGRNNPVEVDCCEQIPENSRLLVCLGIDIGSTSTKAVLLNRERDLVAGFYTRTGGRPLEATQQILEAIDDLSVRFNVSLDILAAGTTGSGRKFIGAVLGADLILNEISAHAKAAVHLNPAVDTIIEIGGQDSKFTTLHEGMVTFSVMNNVCAAGTGSFIEEQAEKLGCPLSEIAFRTEGQAAPLSSDRCTVFMERDLNHLLKMGYTVEEVLASVLHSVRENYLAKVAVQSQIGKTILFQGATGRNRSLVAAFEQRLGKPIHVSRYCHLMGALGVALALLERRPLQSSFRGIGLHRKTIPVRTEVCSLCTNHCKITVGEVDGVQVAYGFLCGRDYGTRRKSAGNPSGFDLLKTRRKVCAVRRTRVHHPEWAIAIPAALHLHEDLPFWKYFFNQLGVPVRTSEAFSGAAREGQSLTGAEFCAPINALHGHVGYLLENGKKSANEQFIFIPFYLEQRPESPGSRRQYCYYTQYAPALAESLALRSGVSRDRILTPLVHYLYHSFHTKAELYRMLAKVPGRKIGFLELSSAFDEAMEFKSRCSRKLRLIYAAETEATKGFHVVLLGRPYSVLSDSMNKGIPGIFGALGIKAFFMDMLPSCEEGFIPVPDLDRDLQWYFAKEILNAAVTVAQSGSAYPVLITSFKCTPDSFVVEYFKEILASHRKPYLVLQLDEHDSTVGYETRIEAAVEAFRNHFESVSRGSSTSRGNSSSFSPARRSDIAEKTLLLPAWDNLTFPLVAAALRREGIDARLLQGKSTTVARSLQSNSGQCTPLSIIAQEFIDHIRSHHLDPGRTVLWLVDSKIACNICMFPRHISMILEKTGGGMERARVYAGALSFLDLSIKLPLQVYFAHMFGGFLRKLACRFRPYECHSGSTDRAVDASLRILENAFLGQTSKESAVTEVVSLFQKIETRFGRRPKVAIFGDLYVRDNDFINQDLIRFIERNGGEVVTTPYSVYVKMVSRPYLRKWIVEGEFLSALSSRALLAMVGRLERNFLEHFQSLLGDREPEFNERPEEILSRYNVRLEHTGESMEHLLKLHYIKQQHPDVALFVQASPAFCCPSIVTEAMAEQIEWNTGVPVVSVTYDGTGGNKNDAIVPYLKFPRKAGVRGLVRIG